MPEKHPWLSKHEVTWTLNSEKGTVSAAGDRGQGPERSGAEAAGCPVRYVPGERPCLWVVHTAVSSCTQLPQPFVTVLITFIHTGCEPLHPGPCCLPVRCSFLNQAGREGSGEGKARLLQSSRTLQKLQPSAQQPAELQSLGLAPGSARGRRPGLDNQQGGEGASEWEAVTPSVQPSWHLAPLGSRAPLSLGPVPRETLASNVFL